MPFVEAMMTSTRDDWETPPEIFNPLNEEFEFTLDPCATPRTAKCTKYFTPEQDGLRQSWAGEVVFMNPLTAVKSGDGFESMGRITARGVGSRLFASEDGH